MKTALLLAFALTPTAAFNFPNPFQKPLSGETAINKGKNNAIALEDALLQSIQNNDNRLLDKNKDDANINDLIQQLEATPCIPEPSIAPEIYGRWKLISTTNVNTSSPIQRTAVDAEKYSIYQDIKVNDNNQLIVSQVVKFGDKAQLCVDALASTSAYPLPELTERQGTGKILGLNLLGVSLVGNEAKEDQENNPNARIKFVFDEGNFDLFNGGLKIPYPVPFRLPLLRDAVKGWIDITYMSERVRISRGNKGTTFILVKEGEE
uniref:Plastid lipid-associated protein/fibrillin conserved domain-containing protein n=1 Tax=Leptocylindrus danicus TaxID=163516 RepID=A0A7S2PCC9_9STRA|mmetsp:Transcript_29271/g.42982  ORF Transcript_29271/g.42982 Transcript_29271/m.42982 type:complete len:264 (+) Transcript_29271:87-878(+)|eukprot:CAMPEP_0116026702 /NCGR_PEP_ID=MMETSP0321-20121206/14056_1 /TAXON_ID=163516 /ORGANISM="Leptocylindrus danicus var. danicus, Strain B650" /LENGTH=263 /DNA_ID=CAMNT_0003499647 /DNA_START=45 /DNA_END=836 /DNA_ORIENTATION=+